jgi:hypothetical protein
VKIYSISEMQTSSGVLASPTAASRRVRTAFRDPPSSRLIDVGGCCSAAAGRLAGSENGMAVQIEAQPEELNDFEMAAVVGNRKQTQI